MLLSDVEGRCEGRDRGVRLHGWKYGVVLAWLLDSLGV